MIRLACMIAAFTLLAQVALASDGVLEINQACATSSAGCFPGDSAGFPVTITASGSYRLTGNLTIPANTTAILVQTSSVTIDLGGFQVKGPNTCSGVPATSCVTQMGAPGISAPTANEFHVEVRHGRVIGMSGPCIDLRGDSASVDDVKVYYCGGGPFEGADRAGGIRVGDYGVVSGSTSLLTLGHGIWFGNGGAALQNEARGNMWDGIYGGGNYGGTFIGNRSFDNGSAAIFGLPISGARTLASKNVVTGQFRSLSAGDNVCNGALC